MHEEDRRRDQAILRVEEQHGEHPVVAVGDLAPQVVSADFATRLHQNYTEEKGFASEERTSLCSTGGQGRN